MMCHIYDNRDIDVEDAKRIVEAEGKLTGGKAVPILHILDKESLPTNDVREYSASPEAAAYCLAEAYITKTMAHKILGNFYVRFNKPTIPCKMFVDEDMAINWLSTFL